MAKRVFRPSFASTVVVLCVLAILLFLGTWQLNRATEKQQLMDSYQVAPRKPVVTIHQVKRWETHDKAWQTYRYRRIQLSGRYDSAHQILLENQIANKQLGYKVLTPFRIANSQDIVLVNRGWLAKQENENFAELAVTDKRQRIQGLLAPLPEVGMRMGSLDQSPKAWPKRIPYLDKDWLSLQLNGVVMPWIILLDGHHNGGLIRQWRPVMRLGPNQHRGYAVQWYLLATVLLCLFVIANLRPKNDS